MKYKVLYSAPNRAHHYIYAKGLFERNKLFKFISGFPRLSKRSKINIPGFPMVKADILQSLYILSLRLPIGHRIQRLLAYWAKLEQDYVSSINLKGCDIVLVYNGSGLRTIKKAKQMGIITIVEAVNTHVAFQEELLREEYGYLGLPWKGSPSKEFNRRLKEYDLADFILLPSEFVKNSFIEKGYAPEKLIKVNYGFKLVENSSMQAKNKSYVEVLYVGTISVRKGVRYLIKAAALLKDLNVRFNIVGPKGEDTGIEDLNIADNIVFSGVLKGESLESAYNHADIFCLPTLEDGYALVLGEALSFGLPIITTVNSGGPDMFNEGVEGFTVPIRSAESIASKIMLLVTDTKLRRYMSAMALKRASTLNGWKENVDCLEKGLESVFERSSKND